MAFTKRQLREALKKTTYSQRHGQSVKKMGMEIMKKPGTVQTARQQEKILGKLGLSREGIKKTLRVEQAAQAQKEAPRPEPKVWEKPQAQGMEKQQPQQPQKGGVKTPGWVEKVEKPGEKAPQKTFGQQNVQEDVRFGKLGQMQSSKTQSQPSSDVDPADRSRYSPGKVDELEQGEQTEYFQQALRTKQFEDLDDAEEKSAKNIDALLGGGGGGETGGGEEK